MSFLVSAALLALAIRGGWQLIPVNESSAYFSSRNVLNHVATNTIWHLGNNLSKTAMDDTNPFKQMSDDECLAVVIHYTRQTVQGIQQ